MTKLRLTIAVLFLVAFAAGVALALSVRGWENPPSGRGSWMARELDLSPEQQQAMAKIWGEVGRDNGHDDADRRGTCNTGVMRRSASWSRRSTRLIWKKCSPTIHSKWLNCPRSGDGRSTPRSRRPRRSSPTNSGRSTRKSSAIAAKTIGRAGWVGAIPGTGNSGEPGEPARRLPPPRSLGQPVE